MKTRFLFITVALFLSTVFSSCWHDHYDHGNISFSVQEDDEEYRLNAKYDDNKTMAVDNYIKSCTGSDYRYNAHGNFDATLVLDDNSRVYIKSREGRLKIKFNKEENSAEAYEKVKDMCDGIKEILAEN